MLQPSIIKSRSAPWLRQHLCHVTWIAVLFNLHPVAGPDLLAVWSTAQGDLCVLADDRWVITVSLTAV